MRVGAPTILLILAGLANVFNLIMVPEQAKLTFFNSSYIEWGKISVKRYSRRSSTYYLNIEGKILQTWNNNVTLNLIFYEYLHNEYRRSFVELHFKYCDLVKSEPYIGLLLRNVGIVCPTLPNEYHLMNMTVPADDFPNVWPFEKGQIHLEGVASDTKAYMFKAYITASFKENKKKLKKPLH